jgi:hypothetical protein
MSKRMMAMLVAMAVGVLQPAFGPVVSAQPREGITVHGHWVIDVRNPDGTLSSHADFQNALTPGGAFILAMLLSREATPGAAHWTIELGPNSNLGAPFGRNGAFILSASIFEAALGDHYGFGTLTLARQDSTVVLKGTATASAAGELIHVSTGLVINIQGVMGTPTQFSGTMLPNGIPLAAGQIIQVTVTLSFS